MQPFCHLLHEHYFILIHLYYNLCISYRGVLLQGGVFKNDIMVQPKFLYNALSTSQAEEGQ
uniref:Uncharacterized protein n=1 Tax=Rhizophora mucronata TaxID=61149 RepID=A0A2P2J5B1_RHIMU